MRRHLRKRRRARCRDASNCREHRLRHADRLPLRLASINPNKIQSEAGQGRALPSRAGDCVVRLLVPRRPQRCGSQRGRPEPTVGKLIETVVARVLETLLPDMVRVKLAKGMLMRHGRGLGPAGRPDGLCVLRSLSGLLSPVRRAVPGLGALGRSLIASAARRSRHRWREQFPPHLCRLAPAP